MILTILPILMRSYRGGSSSIEVFGLIALRRPMRDSGLTVAVDRSIRDEAGLCTTRDCSLTIEHPWQRLTRDTGTGKRLCERLRPTTSASRN